MWDFDPSYLWWFAWIAVFFLPREIWGAFFTKNRKDTFSEFVWWTFDTRSSKVFLAAFLVVLQGHFLFRWPAAAVVMTGAPVGHIIARRMWMATQNRYSALTGAKKTLSSIVEVVAAVAIAAGPQVMDVVLDTAANTPADQLHIPAAWAVAWYTVIRFTHNWWKNRK